MRRHDGDGRYVGSWHDGTWHGQVPGEYSAGPDDLAVGDNMTALRFVDQAPQVEGFVLAVMQESPGDDRAERWQVVGRRESDLQFVGHLGMFNRPGTVWRADVRG